MCVCVCVCVCAYVRECVNAWMNDWDEKKRTNHHVTQSHSHNENASKIYLCTNCFSSAHALVNVLYALKCNRNGYVTSLHHHNNIIKWNTLTHQLYIFVIFVYLSSFSIMLRILLWYFYTIIISQNIFQYVLLVSVRTEHPWFITESHYFTHYIFVIFGSSDIYRFCD